MRVRDDEYSRSAEAASIVRGVGGDAETVRVRESLRDGEYDGDGDRDVGGGVNCNGIACGSVSWRCGAVGGVSFPAGVDDGFDTFPNTYC